MFTNWYVRSSQGRSGVTDWFSEELCWPSGCGRVSRSMIRSTE